MAEEKKEQSVLSSGQLNNVSGGKDGGKIIIKGDNKRDGGKIIIKKP